MGRGDECAGEFVTGPDLAQRIGQLMGSSLPRLDLDRAAGFRERAANDAFQRGVRQWLTDDWEASGGHCEHASAGVNRGMAAKAGVRPWRGSMLSSAPIAERSHSGLVRRFAKPLKGVNLFRGFESLPLRHPSVDRTVRSHGCP